MRVRLFSNGIETFVGPFVGRFVGNVCLAAAHSLKGSTPRERLQYALHPAGVDLQVDGAAVDLKAGQGFAATIMESTLRGMVRGLKGVDAAGVLRIEVEIEREP